MVLKKTKLKLTERKRLAIIRAATREFFHNGYNATSMDAISHAAKVSKRTVYNHFANKQALFDAIVGELEDGILTKEFPPYKPEVPLKKQLYDIVWQEFEITSSEDFKTLFRVVMSEYVRTPETAYNFWRDLQKRRLAMFSWIRDAVADGRLAIEDTDFATRQLGALLKEFVFYPQLLGGQDAPADDEVEKIIIGAIDMFLGYYEVK